MRISRFLSEKTVFVRIVPAKMGETMGLSDFVRQAHPPAPPLKAGARPAFQDSIPACQTRPMRKGPTRSGRLKASKQLLTAVVAEGC
jgi:hypothetical protein